MLELVFFPYKRFQLAFDVTQKYLQRTSQLFYIVSVACTGNQSVNYIFLNACTYSWLSEMLLKYILLMKLFIAIMEKLNVNLEWDLGKPYIWKGFLHLWLSLTMFIMPQYAEIILHDWSLPVVNLQCWVLLHQLVNVPRKKNIMYRGVLNWTSQFARKKCSY